MPMEHERQDFSGEFRDCRLHGGWTPPTAEIPMPMAAPPKAKADGEVSVRFWLTLLSFFWFWLSPRFNAGQN